MGSAEIQAVKRKAKTYADIAATSIYLVHVQQQSSLLIVLG